jgi:hypothetical protein
MERTFKLLFALAVFLFSLISVGIFLLIIKVFLMFYPEVNLLGLVIY